MAGGGFGHDRPAGHAEDVRNGIVSVAFARRYGVALDSDGCVEAATAALRRGIDATHA